MAEGRRIVVKKKGGGHAHHGGAWKVAYADFVTAMMALFMVMWLLASTDQKSRKEISQYFRTGVLPDGDLAMNRAAQLKPSVIEESAIPPAKKASRLDDAGSLRRSIQKLLMTDPELAELGTRVSISVTEEGVLIETVDRDGKSMLFDLASSELKPALVAFLQKLGPLLGQRPNKIRLMGHTDARPFVSKAGKSNWDLSYERASKARRVLEEAGLAAGQITAVQAHGSTQPRNASDPYAAENRRLSILLLNVPSEGDQEAAGPDAAAAQPAAATAATQPPGAAQPAGLAEPTPAPGNAQAAPGASSPAAFPPMIVPAGSLAPAAAPTAPAVAPAATPTAPAAAPTAPAVAPAAAPTAPAAAPGAPTAAPAAAPTTASSPAPHGAAHGGAPAGHGAATPTPPVPAAH